MIHEEVMNGVGSDVTPKNFSRVAADNAKISKTFEHHSRVHLVNARVTKLEGYPVRPIRIFARLSNDPLTASACNFHFQRAPLSSFFSR